MIIERSVTAYGNVLLKGKRVHRHMGFVHSFPSEVREISSAELDGTATISMQGETARFPVLDGLVYVRLEGDHSFVDPSSDARPRVPSGRAPAHMWAVDLFHPLAKGNETERDPSKIKAIAWSDLDDRLSKAREEVSQAVFIDGVLHSTAFQPRIAIEASESGGGWKRWGARLVRTSRSEDLFKIDGSLSVGKPETLLHPATALRIAGDSRNALDLGDLEWDGPISDPDFERSSADSVRRHLSNFCSNFFVWSTRSVGNELIPQMLSSDERLAIASSLQLSMNPAAGFAELHTASRRLLDIVDDHTDREIFPSFYAGTWRTCLRSAIAVGDLLATVKDLGEDEDLDAIVSLGR